MGKSSASFFQLFILLVVSGSTPFAYGNHCPFILSTLKPLSHFSSVSVVDGVDGQKFVVRAQTETSAQRSLFNTSFINSVPGHHAAPIGRMSAIAVREVTEHFRQKDFYNYADPALTWTAEAYLPGTLGSTVLESRGLKSDLVRVLFELPGSNTKTRNVSQGEESIREGILRWPDDNLKALATLLGATAAEEIPFLLRTRLSNQSTEDAMTTVAHVLEISLGARDFHMLCDLWVLTTLLGVFDFHNENWILGGDGISAFDLNQFSLSAADHGVMEFHKQHHPFGHTTTTPFARSLFIKNISPELKTFLSTQSLKTLRKLRIVTTENRSIQTEIDDDDLRQIMNRITYVLRESGVFSAVTE